MDPRKQKRLGPAPIASFEKSFEDTATVTTNGCVATHESNVNRVALTISEMMDSGGNGNDGGGGSAAEDGGGTDDTEKQSGTMVSSDRKGTPSKKQLHDIGGRKPPPIKTTGIFIETVKSATLHTPQTPRIELSRASSSSHHEEDSRDSSPENVFEQVGTGTLQETIGLGFREEGALELRSSTEELYFMDPEAKKEEQEKMQQQVQQARRSSPLIFKFDEHQTYLQQHQRKDSASSEVAALLCISGRTSRISSVGSQGSAVSRLSAISGVSRSPSPHRMLLETSFCGPKPLENIVDGSIVSAVEPPTAEILEQVLLSRKHDPTQAVFAEGITIESSPQRKKPPTSISNGESKRKPSELSRPSRQPSSKITITRETRLMPRKSPGQMVVGTTPSGAEYIRINLKPDHMYEDKGVAANERVIEAPTPGVRSTGHKKPISLSLGRNAAIDEKRLTPSSSPKPSRHSALAKETLGSRSPSPANVSVSRKSSFCSLFKQKESPDSPKDRVRSRSKSRDRSTPQSQNPTPSKQKSVLAIFKPKRSESKSSSPIDPELGRHTPSSKLNTPLETFSATSSRPSSRLRYYDTPADGKSIHIPLHTPPEEKETRKLMQALENRPQSAPSQTPTSATPSTSSAQKHSVPLKTPTPPITSEPQPQIQRQPQPKTTSTAIVTTASTVPKAPGTTEKPEKVRHIENLDAIHTLPQDVSDKERTWSLEVHRHSSQDSQDTIMSDNSLPNNCSAKVSAKTNLENVTESPVRENGIAAEVHRAPEPMPPAPQQPVPVEDAEARERRRLLFATRLGSGSQEQIFSTQFSISKTESLSSQLSEQTSISESPAQEHLQRKDTVLRRPDDTGKEAQRPPVTSRRADGLKKLRSIDDTITPVSKSRSTSEEEKQHPITAAVIMRKKEATREECRRKSSRSASEEDDVATHRHSRYLENFDVRKKFHENVAARKLSNADATKVGDIKVTDVIPEVETKNCQEPVPVPKEVPEPKSSSTSTPLPPAHLQHIIHHHHLPSDRQSVASTDEPVESSESERDSEADPNRLKRHMPRHAVSVIEDHESTGLVSQDSFDDELPYIPTTLPEERAHGVALIPMKERVHMELKTCPLDRPRSTTPLNPSHLEEYCGIVAPDIGDPEHRPPMRGEKLRISLPRKDSTKEKAQKSKSPRRTSTSSGKSWFEFAEEAIRGPPTEGNKQSTMIVTKQCEEVHNQVQSQPEAQDEPPTPTAPVALPNNNNRKPSGQWIDFENIPEKRKAPKKITTLPKDSLADGKNVGLVVHYNYVKPEECQCECHEVERGSAVTHKSIASVDLLQQPGEDMQPLLEPETLDNIDPSDSSRDYSCYTDDETEVPSSNRTQNEEFPLRGAHSPRTKKFPDNRYT